MPQRVETRQKWKKSGRNGRWKEETDFLGLRSSTRCSRRPVLQWTHGKSSFDVSLLLSWTKENPFAGWSLGRRSSRAQISGQTLWQFDSCEWSHRWVRRVIPSVSRYQHRYELKENNCCSFPHEYGLTETSSRYVTLVKQVFEWFLTNIELLASKRTFA